MPGIAAMSMDLGGKGEEVTHVVKELVYILGTVKKWICTFDLVFIDWEFKAGIELFQTQFYYNLI